VKGKSQTGACVSLLAAQADRALMVQDRSENRGVRSEGCFRPVTVLVSHFSFLFPRFLRYA